MTDKILEITKVGSEWVLWGLILLSVLSLGIVIDRAVWFWRHRCDMDQLVPDVLARVDAGDMDGLQRMLRAHRSEEAQIVASCLEWREEGSSAMHNVLQATLRQRRKVVERGSLFLGTVGNNAPFIGLFGTVLGVVQAFVELGDGVGKSMDGVMTAIGEALIATAAGILVAIPAVVAFNVLTRKAVTVEENAETMTNLLLAATMRLERRGA